MTMSRALLCATLLLAASGAAAADLPGRSAPPANYYAPPPAFSWGGFYLGVQGGVGFASFTNGGGQLIGDPTGGLIGVTGGFNYMLAPQFLIGAEADFSFTGVKATTSPFWGAYAKGALDDLLTVRGRAGYVAFDRALLYVSGGFAASKNTIEFSRWPFYGFQASFQPGWALGAGVEYMITQSISAKGEYMFTSTGSGRYFDVSPYALDAGVNMSSVKGGLNYHF